MNTLWITRPAGHLAVIVAGLNVPPCFRPTEAIEAAAARSGLRLVLLPAEAECLPTESEEAAAEDILDALFHQAALCN